MESAMKEEKPRPQYSGSSRDLDSKNQKNKVSSIDETQDSSRATKLLSEDKEKDEVSEEDRPEFYGIESDVERQKPYKVSVEDNILKKNSFKKILVLSRKHALIKHFEDHKDLIDKRFEVFTRDKFSQRSYEKYLVESYN